MFGYQCYYVDDSTVEVHLLEGTVIQRMKVDLEGNPRKEDLVSVVQTIQGYEDKELMEHITRDSCRAYRLRTFYQKSPY